MVHSELGTQLDRLYDKFEKVAITLDDITGTGAGLYAGYAGTTGLLAAYIAYQAAKARQRRAVFGKAQKQRLAARNKSRPAEIYAVPTPVKTKRPEPVEEEDEPDTLKMPGVA